MPAVQLSATGTFAARPHDYRASLLRFFQATGAEVVMRNRLNDRLSVDDLLTNKLRIGAV